MAEYENRLARELANKQRRIDEDAEWRLEIKQQKPVLTEASSTST